MRSVKMWMTILEVNDRSIPSQHHRTTSSPLLPSCSYFYFGRHQSRHDRVGRHHHRHTASKQFLTMIFTGSWLRRMNTIRRCQCFQSIFDLQDMLGVFDLEKTDFGKALFSLSVNIRIQSCIISPDLVDVQVSTSHFSVSTHATFLHHVHRFSMYRSLSAVSAECQDCLGQSLRSVESFPSLALISIHKRPRHTESVRSSAQVPS